MTKSYSRKFWVVFWLIAVLFLVSFYFFLAYQKKGITGITEKLPISSEYQTAITLADYVFQKDGTEKTFLILLQNNMELRPGGGFIGAFGILKIKDGTIVDFQVHDTGNFDARIPDKIVPPKPIAEKLKMDSWKLRDSNFSPDFKVDALKAQEFYLLGNGQENFDGVIGITTNVLTSFLQVTGPVTLPDYPGTFADESAIMQLEYQVEKGFDEQGITRGERKTVINELGEEVMKKALALGKMDKLKLAGIVQEDLNRKDIQLYFKDAKIQQQVIDAKWGGIVDNEWNKDYLLLVDANLGAWKSDYFVKRSVEYTVDLRQEVPQAVLKINYNHTATEKNWLTRDYLSYFRVYAPDGSWLNKTENFVTPVFEKEFNKKSFGAYVYVITGQEKQVELYYSLPKDLAENYALKIQKQAGLNDVPWKVKIISKNGKEKNYDFVLNEDKILTQ